MKKLTKLNLNDLKVESFVTSLENESSNTVKGGASPLSYAVLSFTLGGLASVIIIGSMIATGKDKICDTAAYCGNTHDGGNGCSVGACN